MQSDFDFNYPDLCYDTTRSVFIDMTCIVGLKNLTHIDKIREYTTLVYAGTELHNANEIVNNPAVFKNALKEYYDAQLEEKSIIECYGKYYHVERVIDYIDKYIVEYHLELKTVE